MRWLILFKRRCCLIHEHSSGLTRSQLSLELGCNAAKQTVFQKRFMAYPYSVSPLFRREENDLGEDPSKRAYLYRMNTSPGLLAGDSLGVSIQLASDSQLHLVDQSADKSASNARLRDSCNCALQH